MSQQKESTAQRRPISSIYSDSSSLDYSMTEEYDEKGWLDCNPEAKMELSDLEKEEYISDDEVEVRLSCKDCVLWLLGTCAY